MTTTSALPSYSATVRDFITTYKTETAKLMAVKVLMERSGGICRALTDQDRLGMLDGDPLLTRIQTTMMKEFASYRKQEQSAKESMESLHEKAKAFSSQRLTQPQGDSGAEPATRFQEIRKQVSPALGILADRVDHIRNVQVISTWNLAKNDCEAALVQAKASATVANWLLGFAPTSAGGKWTYFETTLGTYEKSLVAAPATDGSAAAKVATAEAPAAAAAPTPEALTFEQEAAALTELFVELKTLIATYPAPRATYAVAASPAASPARPKAAPPAGVRDKADGARSSDKKKD